MTVAQSKPGGSEMERVSISPLGLHKALAIGQLHNTEQQITRLLDRYCRSMRDAQSTMRELEEAEKERLRLQFIIEATE
jgi:hypothetical protein